MTPKVSDVIIRSAEMLHIFDSPLLLARNYGLTIEQRFIKRLIDIVFSAIFIVITSPFMLITAIYVKVYDGGPVLFKQKRLTYNHKEFYVYKFRSMIVDAEKDGVARLAKKNDSRITSVGNIIRKNRLEDFDYNRRRKLEDVKISIIMPVYKVEKYVGKAIESIQKQSLKEYEFLIVDDGTPDRSGEICDEYAKNDSRIHVIHKENGGAPSARNAAIDIAKGKYMYFMDSDDWAEPEMLKDMYEMAEKNQSQLVVTGFYIDTYYQEDRFISEKICVDDAVYQTAVDFRKNAYKYYDRNLLYTPWNKLYLASYIKENKLKFPNTLWDDFPFNISVVRNIERVSISTNAYYHFIRARAESETAAYRPGMYEKREEEHGWLLDLFEEWNVHTKETEEMLARRYIERIIGCIENLTNKKCELTYKEKRGQVKKMFQNNRVKDALRTARVKSVYMKIMLIPIRLKNITLTLWEASVISWVKRNNTKLFAQLKAGR